jgi:DNA recombination protein RmuC
MDVKFPFENYQRGLLAGDAESRARAEAAFVRDVRARIAEVAGRSYIAPETGTLDVALLFIPNERVFESVVGLAPELVDEALAKGVVLASPTTLIAILAVLRRAATVFHLARSTRALGQALAELRAAWDGWVAESEGALRRLDEAAEGFRALAARRRVRLDRALGRLDALLEPGSGPPPPA